MNATPTRWVLHVIPAPHLIRVQLQHHAQHFVHAHHLYTISINTTRINPCAHTGLFALVSAWASSQRFELRQLKIQSFI